MQRQPQRTSPPQSLSSPSLRRHLAKQKLHTLRCFSTLHELGQKNIDTKKQFSLGCAVPIDRGAELPIKINDSEMFNVGLEHQWGVLFKNQ